MKKLFVLALVVFGLSTTQPACPGPVGPIVNSLVDCLGENRTAIDKLIVEFKPLIFAGKISWADVKVRATQAGKDVGGCFIMELTQLYLSGTRAPEDAVQAREAAETFREQNGNATYRTMCVREDGTAQECKL